MAETLRAFVAVPVTAPAARETLSRLARETAAGLRWVPSAQLHFTLKFLAAVDAALLPAMERALAEAAAGVPRFRLELRGLGTFPPRGPARVLWAGCGEGRGALEELARRVEDAFRGVGVANDERPFTAHLTLARVRDPRGGREAAAAARGHADVEIGTLDVVETVLYRSVLGSEGAAHTVLARARLGG